MSVSSGLGGETAKLAVGWLLIAGFALVLFGSLLPGVSFPAVLFALLGVGLFAGTYLVGTARDERTF